MAEREQVPELRQQPFRTQGHDFVIGKRIPAYIVLSVEHVAGKRAQAAALRLLAVFPRLEHVGLYALEYPLVGHCVENQVLDQGEGLAHVLAESAERKVRHRRAAAERITAPESVHP